MRRRIKFSDYYQEIITKEIEDIYSVDRDRIFLGSRQRDIILAKRLFIFTLREVFGLTLKEIAKTTNLHHASVIHHYRQFEFEYAKKKFGSEENFERVENRIIEVEIDEEIEGLERELKKTNESLTKLYKINKLKHEREKRENLLTE